MFVIWCLLPVSSQWHNDYDTKLACGSVQGRKFIKVRHVQIARNTQEIFLLGLGNSSQRLFCESGDTYVYQISLIYVKVKDGSFSFGSASEPFYQYKRSMPYVHFHQSLFVCQIWFSSMFRPSTLRFIRKNINNLINLNGAFVGRCCWFLGQ